MTNQVTTIRVDAEVYAELEKKILSFSDTPNAVLRRLLGLDAPDNVRRVGEAHALYLPWLTGFRRGRPPQSEPRQTAQSKFTRPILEALAQSGGEARAKDVLDEVGQKVASDLLPADAALLSNGEPRWRVSAAFERQNLIQRGLLAHDAPRGIWRITEAGRAWLRTQDAAAGLEGWDLSLGLDVATRVIRENRQWLQEMASR
jgi:hypothetical protein